MQQVLNEDKLVRDKVKILRFINEAASRSDIANSIRNHEILYIYYEGDDTVDKGYRTIEPYALGVTSKGNLALRAWQQAGATDTGKNIKTPYSPLRRGKNIQTTTNWRLFLVDNITSLLKTGEKFPPYGDNFRPGYNPNDEQLRSIIAAVDTTQTLEPEIKGTGDVDKPNVAFGPQTDKMKLDLSNLSSKQSQVSLRQFINNKFEIISKYHKKSPNNFNVVKTKNEYLVKPIDYNLKSDEQVIGNLGNMKQKFNQLSNIAKADTSFKDSEYKDWLKNEKNRNS